MNAAAFQQHYDNMAEPDDGMDEQAAAAGMDTDEFRAMCEKQRIADEREAEFAELY